MLQPRQVGEVDQLRRYLSAQPGGSKERIFESTLVILTPKRLKSNKKSASASQKVKKPKPRVEPKPRVLDALEKKIPVEPSETWADRQEMGIPAKLVVLGMVANNFTIADPEDAGMMDVVGFDSAAPALIADFAKTLDTPAEVEAREQNRHEYELKRAERPERKEHKRRHAQAKRQEAKSLGLCVACGAPPIPDQTSPTICARYVPNSTGNTTGKPGRKPGSRGSRHPPNRPRSSGNTPGPGRGPIVPARNRGRSGHFAHPGTPARGSGNGWKHSELDHPDRPSKRQEELAPEIGVYYHRQAREKARQQREQT